jgi:hypothetical protein
MTTYQLLPLSIGEILDGALVLLRRHFGLVLGIAVVCEGIPTAMDVYIDLTGGAAQDPGLSLLDRLLTLVGSVLVTGATVRVVSEIYLGRSPLFGDAMRFAGHRFGTILGANIMSGFLTVLATFLLVIPGIVVACGYSVAAQAAALESGSSGEALRRSWDLTKGFKWKALALGVVSIALILILYVGAGVLGGVLAGGHGRTGHGPDGVRRMCVVDHLSGDFLRLHPLLLRPAGPQGGLRPRDAEPPAGARDLGEPLHNS